MADGRHFVKKICKSFFTPSLISELKCSPYDRPFIPIKLVNIRFATVMICPLNTGCPFMAVSSKERFHCKECNKSNMRHHYDWSICLTHTHMYLETIETSYTELISYTSMTMLTSEI